MSHEKVLRIFIQCCVLLSIFSCHCQEVGDSCKLEDGTIGHCSEVINCRSAKKDIKEGRSLQHCGFQGLKPIVCCRLKPGEKAEYFCERYRSITTPQYIAGGRVVQPKDYQHMVALGFGNNPKNIEWLCGGSLISPDFVLTAAHCLNSQEHGGVRWARIGELNLASNNSNDSDNITIENSDFQIKNIYRHPKYKSPSKYNDIALLQLEKEVYLNRHRRPICINTKFEIPSEFLPTATGWGLTDYAGERSDRLLVVDLNIFSNKICEKTYERDSKRALANGIDEASQLCAGGQRGENKDTCKGDSGGPLQIKHPKYPTTFYLIIGVTSFGKACGLSSTPGVYTRVSHYISWIEDIVWKNETLYPHDD